MVKGIKDLKVGDKLIAVKKSDVEVELTFAKGGTFYIDDEEPIRACAARDTIQLMLKAMEPLFYDMEDPKRAIYCLLEDIIEGNSYTPRMDNAAVDELKATMINDVEIWAEEYVEMRNAFEAMDQAAAKINKKGGD